MKALLVDAYDSFVYIIYQYLSVLGVDTVVIRNDLVDPTTPARVGADLLVLGPGPGHPADARYLPLLIGLAAPRDLPVLGICLGHQAVGLAFGAQVERARRLRHGKTSPIRHDGSGCFAGLPSPLTATRYHSLIVTEQELPAELVVTARAEDDGYVMGLRHRSRPIESVQFHPESVCTEEGIRLFDNFLTTYVRGDRRAAS